MPSFTSNMTNIITHEGEKRHGRTAVDFLNTSWKDLHTGSLDWNMLISDVAFKVCPKKRKSQ